MKQQEFFQLIDSYGLNLNKLSITVGEISGWEGAHGVYEKDGKWIYFSADGRNHINKKVMDSEDQAFDEIFQRVNFKLGFITNMFITRDIAKLPKKMICEYMQKEYSLTEQQANNAWDYLKQDMRVLFEFKYYVANGKFVPDECSYKVKGCSAEQISQTTSLNAFESFKNIINLYFNPNETLN